MKGNFKELSGVLVAALRLNIPRMILSIIRIGLTNIITFRVLYVGSGVS